MRRLLRRVFLQEDRPIRVSRDAVGFFLGYIALNGLFAVLNPALRHWGFAVLTVVYGILLTLLFARARIGQKRRNEERRQHRKSSSG